MTSFDPPIGGPSDLHQIDVAPPADGEIVRLADDLVWYRFRMPFRLNHINLFALETDSGWVLVDCGINTDDTSAQWDVILPQLTAQRPIAGILVTHHHGDHIGHAGPLAERTGAPILMGRAEFDMAQAALVMNDAEYGDMTASAYANFGITEEVIERNRQIGNYYRQLVAPLPDVTIIESTWRLHTVAGEWSPRFDAGHSPGHLGLIDNERQLYLAIDSLLGRISPNISVSLREPDGDVLAGYYDYLNGLEWLTAEWRIFCGHDWHYVDGARRARQLIHHHDRRLDQLRATTAPQTTADAIRTLFPMELTDHESYFASCEARAHLNHLVTRGEMARETDGGIARFTPL